MIQIPELSITKVTYRLLIENIVHFMNFPEAGLRGAMGYFWNDGGRRFAPLYETFFGFPSATTLPKAGMLRVCPVKDAPDKVLLQVTFFGKRESLVGDFSKTLLVLGREGIGKRHNRFIVEGMTTPKTGSLAEFMAHGESSDLERKVSPEHEWTLRLNTALSLRGANGEILEHWDCETFGRNLINRIMGVVENYGTPVDWDAQLLLENFMAVPCMADEHVERRNRTSTRQQKNIDYSGIVGRVVLRGLTSDTVALIRMGEQLAVGKNTVFGNGRIRLVPGGFEC